MRGRLAPIVTIGVNIAGIWCPLETYVDSGAAYSVLQVRVARGLDFDYRAGGRTSLQIGDGSFIPVYLHDLEVQLGTERVTAKVGFSERLGIGFNLLGRTGIFDQFRICFDEDRSVLTFEPR